MSVTLTFVAGLSGLARMSDQAFTVGHMKPPLCEICANEADLNGGLVSFIPSETDLEWWERESEEPTMGHPPDSAWVCEQHWAVAHAISPFTTIEQGLAYTSQAGNIKPEQLDRAVSERRAQGVDIHHWEGVLRRMIPDLTVEAGGMRVGIDFVEQNSWWERDDNPTQVDEWALAQQWSSRDFEASVCLYTHTAYWRVGGRARKEAVLMVTPRKDRRPRWQVTAVTPVGRNTFGPEHVEVEGAPSPMMCEVLATYGLLRGAHRAG